MARRRSMTLSISCCIADSAAGWTVAGDVAEPRDGPAEAGLGCSASARGAFFGFAGAAPVAHRQGGTAGGTGFPPRNEFGDDPGIPGGMLEVGPAAGLCD